MKSQFVLGLAVTIFSLEAGASQRVGNGGHVAICTTENGTTRRLLDYLDGDFRFVPLGGVALGTSTNPVEMAEHAFRRLARVDTARADRYLRQLAVFMTAENLRFLPDNYLLPVQLAPQDYMIPRECTVTQMAANTIPTQPEEPKYWIYTSHWNALSAVDQAGLIIHEIVHNDALERYQLDYAYARYVTYLLSSQKMETISQEEYDAKILANNFAEVRAHVDLSFRPAETYRFFEGLSLTYPEANAYCEKLPGRTRLATRAELLFGDLNLDLLRGPIGKYITRHGARRIWIKNDQAHRSFELSETLPENEEQTEGFDDRFSFVCIALNESI